MDYTELGNYLADTDLGVSTHNRHIETTFSFRTRIRNYLWVFLLIGVTEDNHFTQIVNEHDVGVSAPSEDVDSHTITITIEHMLFENNALQAAQKAFSEILPNFEWGIVLEPLVGFVQIAHYAADRVKLGEVRLSNSTTQKSKRKRPAGDNGRIEHIFAFETKRISCCVS